MCRWDVSLAQCTAAPELSQHKLAQHIAEPLHALEDQPVITDMLSPRPLDKHVVLLLLDIAACHISVSSLQADD